jgi:anti-sigma factor RsiW
MTTCERAQSLFGAAWDDELSVAEREALERHFTGCSSCRREYDELARTLELVQSLPKPQVEPEFATRVLAEARRREAERPIARRLPWPFAGARAAEAAGAGAFGMRPAVALAAAVVAVFGVTATLWLHPFAPATRSGPDAPAVAVVPPPAAQAPTAQAPAVAAVPAPQAGTNLAQAGPVRPAAVPGRKLPGTAVAREAGLPDSLFDHSADVELVLDPVKLRRERGRGYTPVSSPVQGEAASITF